MPRANVREKILETAGKLFYRDGIHATGIDTIVAESEVARMSLYNHFPSKEALIEAVLRRQSQETQKELAGLQTTDFNPDDRLRMLFEGLEEVLQSPEYFGCPFINATAEYSAPTHLFHQIAAQYKQMYRESIGQIVADMDVSNTETLTAQIFLLVEGSLVTAQVDRDTRQRTAKNALAAARILVEYYRKKPL